jgi:SOS-response transcriptional repressor LexA
MSTIAEAGGIIKRLMAAAGAKNLVALARWLDVTPSACTRALGRRKVPDAWLYKVAYRTGVTIEWLRTGKGERLDPRFSGELRSGIVAESRADYGAARGRMVPVLTWIQAGALTAATDLYPYAGAAEDYVPVPVKGKRCFALRVRGDSMLPAFMEGDTIVVDPDRAPQSGDLVVAVVDDAGEATFKQYLNKRDGQVLHPLNASYKEIPLAPEHRIVGKVIRLIRSF